MKHVLVVSFALALCSCAAPTREPGAASRNTSARPIYELDELTWRQIDALDRARTVVILPIGMVEQHGPHLPVGADTLAVVHEAHAIAREVSRASPGWNVVMMPPIPYGHSGANVLGDRPIHPGTYGLRQSTFRSLLADIGAQLAQNGFEWIFVLNGHGAPSHGLASIDACDFVSERFALTMLDVTALFRADPQIQSRGAQVNAEFFTAEQLESFGMDVHAGVGETAGILVVRPDLVRPDYRTLPNQTGHTLEELRAIASAPGWQGYLSAPALATAQYGAAVEKWWIEGATELILDAIRGEDMSKRPRLPGSPAAAHRAAHRERARERSGIRRGARPLARATSAVMRANLTSSPEVVALDLDIENAGREVAGDRLPIELGDAGADYYCGRLFAFSTRVK